MQHVVPHIRGVTSNVCVTNVSVLDDATVVICGELVVTCGVADGVAIVVIAASVEVRTVLDVLAIFTPLLFSV